MMKEKDWDRWEAMIFNSDDPPPEGYEEADSIEERVSQYIHSLEPKERATVKLTWLTAKNALVCIVESWRP